MGKGKIDKQVYEQYMDATVALFMEHYAAALTDTVSHAESSAVPYPKKLDERCIGMIKKECARQRSRAFWKGAKRVLSSAAILLVALLSLSSILFMTVEAFRVPVINFFIEQGDGFWAITGQDNTQDAPEDSATRDFDENDPLVGLIPEEYELINVRENSEKGQRAVYQAPSGAVICFAVYSNSSDITIDSANAVTSKKCVVAGCEGVYVSKDNSSQLAWINKGESTSYLLSADAVDENNLLSIAEQLMKKVTK